MESLRIHTVSDLANMRAWLRDGLDWYGVEADDAFDIVLAVQEAAANALRHSDASPGPVCVRMILDEDSLWIEVSDEGSGPDLEGRALKLCPNPEMERGRGLYLIACLMDVVECVPRGAGSLIRLGKLLPPQQAAA